MYRIGFITDGETVGKQCQELIELIGNEPGFEVAAIVVQDLPPSDAGRVARLRTIARKRGIGGLAADILLSRIYRWESRKLGDAAVELGSVEISAPDAVRVRVSPIISRSGHVVRYPADVVATIKKLKLDALVRCGSGILKGEILRVARCGVLSLHHGDNRINRGIPAAFWEALNQEPTTGFVVQQLSEELDGGTVYFRGSLPTSPRYTQNLAALYAVSTQPFAETLFRVVRGTATSEEPHLYDRHLHRSPGLTDVVRYLRNRLASKVRTAINLGLRRRDHWGVAYYRGSWRTAVLWRGTQLTQPPGTFLADPFAYERDDRQFVFVEEFDYRRSKGVISVYEIGAASGDKRLGICLEEDTHLSYPFVFEHDGQLYMCPETAKCEQVRLYKCIEFPLRWQLEAVLLDGIKAVDTNIIRRGGKWWMIASVENSRIYAHSLQVFHAEELTGPWQRCESSSLVDGRRARNGGMLRDGDQWYRVSQHGHFGDYGNGVAIHRIDALSEQEYHETTIQEIAPRFFSGLSGIHHLHNAGQLLVYDFKRRERPC